MTIRHEPNLYSSSSGKNSTISLKLTTVRDSQISFMQVLDAFQSITTIALFANNLQIIPIISCSLKVNLMRLPTSGRIDSFTCKIIRTPSSQETPNKCAILDLLVPFRSSASTVLLTSFVTRFALAFASFHAWPKSYTTHLSNLLYHKLFPLWAEFTNFLI